MTKLELLDMIESMMYTLKMDMASRDLERRIRNDGI